MLHAIFVSTALRIKENVGWYCTSRSGVVYSLQFSGNRKDVLRGDGSFTTLAATDASSLTLGNACTDPAIIVPGTTDNLRIRDHSKGTKNTRS